MSQKLISFPGLSAVGPIGLGGFFPGAKVLSVTDASGTDGRDWTPYFSSEIIYNPVVNVNMAYILQIGLVSGTDMTAMRFIALIDTK